VRRFFFLGFCLLAGTKEDLKEEKKGVDHLLLLRRYLLLLQEEEEEEETLRLQRVIQYPHAKWSGKVSQPQKREDAQTFFF
jgi:hypothetical protein